MIPMEVASAVPAIGPAEKTSGNSALGSSHPGPRRVDAGVTAHSIYVLRIKDQDLRSPAGSNCPVALSYGFLRLIKKTIDLPLDALAGHCVGNSTSEERDCPSDREGCPASLILTGRSYETISSTLNTRLTTRWAHIYLTPPLVTRRSV